MIRVSIAFNLIIVAGLYEENADLRKLGEYAELLTASIEDIKKDIKNIFYQFNIIYPIGSASSAFTSHIKNRI